MLFQQTRWTLRFWIASKTKKSLSMSPESRDISILERIIVYCNEIDATKEYFGDSKDVLLVNSIYEKMAIHSQSELIAIFERYAEGNEE